MNRCVLTVTRTWVIVNQVTIQSDMRKGWYLSDVFPLFKNNTQTFHYVMAQNISGLSRKVPAFLKCLLGHRTQSETPFSHTFLTSGRTAIGQLCGGEAVNMVSTDLSSSFKVPKGQFVVTHFSSRAFIGAQFRFYPILRFITKDPQN